MSLATIGTVIGLGSAVVSGVAGFQASNYRAAVASANQKIAEDNATRALQRSQVEQQDQDALTLAMIGEQEAAQSASGLSLGSKSFVLTRKAAKDLGRKDALNVRQAGELEAYNYRTDAMNFGAEAGAARSEGRFALLEGFAGGASSLVGGAARSPQSKRFKPEPYTARLPYPRPKSLVR